MYRSAPSEGPPLPVIVTVAPSPPGRDASPPEAEGGRRRWPWALGAVVVLVAAVWLGGGDGDRVVQRRSQDLETVGSLATVPPSRRQASVRIEQESPLVDGSIVEVTGTGFPDDAEVELRQCVGRRVCLRLEAVEVSGAQGTNRSSFRTDDLGTFSARVALRRYVLIAGEHRLADCTDTAVGEGCDLTTVIYFSSKSQYPPPTPLRFVGGGEPPQQPVVVADATSGLSDSQRIEVAGLGFRPGSTVRPVMCDAATATGCQPLAVEGPGIVGADATVVLRVVVNERLPDLDCRPPRACMITLLPEQSGGRRPPAGLPVSFGE